MGDNLYYDVYEEFKGYTFTIFTKNGKEIMLSLNEEEFNEKNQLVLWLDFLIKTDQWIPYPVWFDLFKLPENQYFELKEVKQMKVCYFEVVNKIKQINLL